METVKSNGEEICSGQSIYIQFCHSLFFKRILTIGFLCEIPHILDSFKIMQAPVRPEVSILSLI